MNVLINGMPCELRAEATLADAIDASALQPPFAAAVNHAFVPRSAHATRLLQPGDRIELIRPVTGG